MRRFDTIQTQLLGYVIEATQQPKSNFLLIDTFSNPSPSHSTGFLFVLLFHPETIRHIVVCINPLQHMYCISKKSFDQNETILESTPQPFLEYQNLKEARRDNLHIELMNGFLEECLTTIHSN